MVGITNNYQSYSDCDSECSGISAIICIKPLDKDMWVSGTIKKTGAWETETLINVIEVLNRFKNATFVGK